MNQQKSLDLRKWNNLAYNAIQIMYRILENNLSNYTTDNGVSLDLVDKIYNSIWAKKIIIKDKSNVKYLLISHGSELDLDVICEGEDINVEIYCILISKSKDPIKGKIITKLQNSNIKLNKYILSFVWDEWQVSLDANIKIEEWVTNVEWHLLEENLILWEKVKIKTLPMLDIHSNDVVASHGAKIDRLDKDKLFYMTSKGIDLAQSQELIVSGYINNILEKFHSIWEENIEELKNEIMNYLHKNK